MNIVAKQKFSVIMTPHWRRSSVVEQRNHNPLVRGPNPFAATKITNDPRWSFFILVSGICRPAQGSDPQAKGRWKYAGERSE